MWRFFDLAGSIFARSDDSNGVISSVFRAAVADLGAIAPAANVDPKTFAGEVFAQLKTSNCSHRDEIVATLAPTLKKPGLNTLKSLVEAYGTEELKA